MRKEKEQEKGRDHAGKRQGNRQIIENKGGGKAKNTSEIFHVLYIA